MFKNAFANLQKVGKSLMLPVSGFFLLDVA